MEPTKALEPMMNDHSRSYRSYIRSADWYARRRAILKIWRNRCALFPWMAADECHHLTYRNLTREVPWRDCLPLSKFAHQLVHHPILWQSRKPKSFRRRGVNLVLRTCALVSWAITRAIAP